jgi:drug/metabolite transporter (DMT)-like permease
MPGPLSFSKLGYGAHMTQFLLTAVLWAVSYLLVTQGIASLPPAALLAARGIGVAVLGAGSWFLLRRRLEALDPVDLFVVGAVGLGGAAVLEVYRRGLFFPSGADVVFMLATVPVWAALARIVRGDRSARNALLASLFLVAANGIILANWERPSTFAPFALFPASEAALLGAAALWAIGGVEAQRRMAGRPVLERTAVAGLGAAWLVVLVPFGVPAQGLTGPSDVGVLVAIALVSGGALTLVWHDAVDKLGAQAAAFACGAAPFVLTAYVFVERRYGSAHGPVPLVAVPVAVGAALAACALAAGLLSGGGAPGAAETADEATREATEEATAESASEAPEPRKGPRTHRKAISAVLGALSALAAAVGLILPSVRLAIDSQPEVGSFSVLWESGGFATVGGTLAVLCVVAAFAAPAARRRDMAWGVLLAAAGIAVIWGGFSQWSAHYSWLPPRVLQALGSPYVLLTETPLVNMGVLAAPWLALAAWTARLGLVDGHDATSVR